MTVIRNIFLTAGYAVLAGFAVCSSQQRLPSSPSYEEKPLVKKEGLPLEKVLVIGIDGLRPDALQKATTPHIDALVVEGAYSFATRTGEYTISFPGWSSIFTGVWENKHGIFANPGDDVKISANFDGYPSFFTRAEQYQPGFYTVGLGGWDSVNAYIVKSLDKKVYHSCGEHGEHTAASDQAIARDAADILAKENPDLMFVYFLGVDVAGHNRGFSPEVPEYIQAVEQIDLYVGQIMEAVTQRPSYPQEEWLTILVSDHGGKGKSHDGVGEEAKKVPLILHGPGIEKGEIVPAPVLVDVAPTALYFLGVPIYSQWELDGKVVGLKESYLK